MGIRLEESDDWNAVLAIYEAAFGQSAEGDIVQRLNADGDLVLSLMAYAEKPVGHIAFSSLVLDECPAIKGSVLAPLAVIPSCQKQGIGAALVRESLNRMAQMGFDLAVVLGDPNYYGRFGFTPQLARRLKTPYDGPYVQALALSAKGKEARGHVSYARAFAELK